MSLKNLFIWNWSASRKKEKTMLRPREVKRRNKNGKKSRLNPWRKSAPPDFNVGGPPGEPRPRTSSTLEPLDAGNYNEVPVDCRGLTNSRHPLTVFDWKYSSKAKSYFNLVDATIDLDAEIRKRSGYDLDTNSHSDSSSMPKLVPVVDEGIKTDSGYDSNSFKSSESGKDRKDSKCYSVYGTKEFKTFNSFFKRTERGRSSSCSRVRSSIDERIREQETYLKNWKDQISTPPESIYGRKQTENIYAEFDNLSEEYHAKNDANKYEESNEYKAVVAIDIGTTHSGYAYALSNANNEIYLMRKLDGGDCGVFNQKCPTSLLLTNDGSFRSFGYTARDYYHNLEPHMVKQYLYFDKFKTSINNMDLTRDSKISAASGSRYPAVEVFSHCLTYFKNLAVSEIADVSGSVVAAADVLWVITVPAIWKPSAKQLMRLAADKAGLAGRVEIALEPEAASLFCRELKMNQVIPCTSMPRSFLSMPSSFRRTFRKQMAEGKNQPAVQFSPCTAYMVVDCGGGTVDITVHQIVEDGVSLKELYRASGGPHGSAEIDACFEALLCDIFTTDFVDTCKRKYPAAFVDLFLAFESRKRIAHPYKQNSLNVPLPFSFIEFHKKFRGFSIEKAVKRYKSAEISWSSQGMLTLSAKAMEVLFTPTLSAITRCISEALTCVTEQVSHLFLVGGFAESSVLQQHIRNNFGQNLKIIIPNEVGSAVLKGAVIYGLEPGRIVVRRSRYTYGIAVLHPFDPDQHPRSKLVVQNGRKFCKDIFEKFVTIDQSVPVGEEMSFAYRPAAADRKQLCIQMFSTDVEAPKYVTDEGVRKCASLKLKLPDQSSLENADKPREIKTKMKFGDTEIKFSALDVNTGITVECLVDFLSH